MTHNLTGLNRINKITLSGKNDVMYNNTSYKIKLLKDNILNTYLVPLFSKQWDILNENSFFIDHYLQQLISFYKTYKLDELLVYIELLKILKLLLDKHNLLIDIESQHKIQRDPNEVVSMIYKTSMIRLLPEYEIYNSILGRPKRENNENYNENVIIDIKKCIQIESTSFQKIKDYIEHKYVFVTPDIL
jgi:hypothetical protein